MKEDIDWNQIPAAVGRPDFRNLLAVLNRQKPDRPTLFEFFLNSRLHNRLAQRDSFTATERLAPYVQVLLAYSRVGYDYSTVSLPGFSFPTGAFDQKKSRSENQGALIHDWETFKAYPWLEAEAADYAMIDDLAAYLPEGMKLIIHGPGGVLENATMLVGYEALCTLILDDPKLADEIFAQIGSRLVRYYELSATHPAVGACISNDDWGFKTQTMFSPRDMRRFVFPWHKKIVQAIHAAGKPATLHSCGHFERILEDIVVDMGYDGRHSYEDLILPVEKAYVRYHDRMAILGGIDVDFVCRSSPRLVYERSKNMLNRAAEWGGFALGTGNSVPEYVPDAGYFAMVRAAMDGR